MASKVTRQGVRDLGGNSRYRKTSVNYNHVCIWEGYYSEVWDPDYTRWVKEPSERCILCGKVR